jgi:putative methyltransferase
LAGGASLFYEHQQNWFKQYSYIDLVCKYSGYGEVFITDFLDGKPVKEIPFAIYPDLGRNVWNESPATYNKREFNWPFPYKDNIEYLKRFKEKHTNVKVILDTSRGCPYGCTFCEWGGGTTTKVVFKSLEETLEEIELIFDNLQPDYVDIINANFGIIDKDKLVAKRIAELHNKHNKCVLMVNIYGPTKTNKENLKEIYEVFAANKMLDGVKLSIQSTDQTVLKNIKRIDMPYDKQFDLYNDLCSRFDVPLRFEIMLGLPGETLTTFYKTIGDISRSSLLYPMIHEWQMLPSAPAAHPSYVEEFKIKTKLVKFIRNEYDTHIVNRSDYGNLVNATGKRNLLVDQEYLAPYDMVVSTYSYSEEDFVQMHLFKYYFTFLYATKIISPIIKYLKDYDVDLAEFNRSLFQDFLIKIPQVRKSYDQYVADIKSNESINMFHTDIAPNLPYISHYSLLKFLILLDPNSFFKAMASWLSSKYGDGDMFEQICERIASNINTPMKKDIPNQQKIRECLALCKYWRSDDLFFDNFRPEY